MAKWKYRLELKDLWKAREKKEISIKELGKKVAERIKQSVFYKKNETALWEIVDNFSHMEEDIELFDEILDDLYDWADTPLFTRRGEMQRKLCWVGTFF